MCVLEPNGSTHVSDNTTFPFYPEGIVLSTLWTERQSPFLQQWLSIYTPKHTHDMSFPAFLPPRITRTAVSSVFSQEGSRGQICMHVFWESLFDNGVCVLSTHLNTHFFLAPKTVINGFFKTRFDFCLLMLEFTHFKQCFAAVPLRFWPLLWLDEHYKVPYFTLLFITMGWSSYCVIVV